MMMMMMPMMMMDDDDDDDDDYDDAGGCVRLGRTGLAVMNTMAACLCPRSFPATVAGGGGACVIDARLITHARPFSLKPKRLCLSTVGRSPPNPPREGRVKGSPAF